MSIFKKYLKYVNDKKLKKYLNLSYLDVIKLNIDFKSIQEINRYLNCCNLNIDNFDDLLYYKLLKKHICLYWKTLVFLLLGLCVFYLLGLVWLVISFNKWYVGLNVLLNQIITIEIITWFYYWLLVLLGLNLILPVLVLGFCCIMFYLIHSGIFLWYFENLFDAYTRKWISEVNLDWHVEWFETMLNHYVEYEKVLNACEPIWLYKNKLKFIDFKYNQIHQKYIENLKVLSKDQLNVCVNIRTIIEDIRKSQGYILVHANILFINSDLFILDSDNKLKWKNKNKTVDFIISSNLSEELEELNNLWDQLLTLFWKNKTKEYELISYIHYFESLKKTSKIINFIIQLSVLVLIILLFRYFLGY